MVADFERPFANIESAQEYVRLLSETLLEAQGDIQRDIEGAQRENAVRRQEALYLVHYKLIQLHEHLCTASHILNDLRTLRRLLLGERRTNDSATDVSASRVAWARPRQPSSRSSGRSSRADRMRRTFSTKRCVTVLRSGEN